CRGRIKKRPPGIWPWAGAQGVSQALPVRGPSFFSRNAGVSSLGLKASRSAPSGFGLPSNFVAFEFLASSRLLWSCAGRESGGSESGEGRLPRSGLLGFDMIHCPREDVDAF